MAQLPTYDEDSPTGKGKPYLSPSQIAAFRDCPYRWYLRYVVKAKGIAKTWRMMFGVVVHEAIEYDLKLFAKTGLWVPESSVSEFILQQIEEAVEKTPLGPDETIDGFHKEAIKLFALYRTEVAPKLNVFMVEKKIMWPLHEEFDVVFKIDLVESEHGRIILDDWKVSASTKKLNAEDWFQGKVEAAGWLYEEGELPDEARLIRFNRRKRVPFIDMARVKPTMPDVEMVKQEAFDVFSNIKNDLFPPTGLGTGACHYCDYRLSGECKPRDEYEAQNP